MNILFIGNSYTFYNEMPEMFRKLSNDNGRNVNVYSVTKGGRKLIDFETADEVTQNLSAILSANRFDVCIIQEQSVIPAYDFDTFDCGLTQVVDMIGDRADRLVLYATWGRKDGSPVLEEDCWTREGMTELITDSYCKAAEKFGADVSNVGKCFAHIKDKFPHTELYCGDLSHPSYKGSCLAAMTHYYTVFGCLPENCDSLSLDAAEISAFKTAICG